MRNLKLGMLAVLLLTQFYVNAQEVFDLTFGENGISTFYDNGIFDVQFQGENNILSQSMDMLDNKVTMYRSNLDGVLDETFGNDGLFESYGHLYGSWNFVLDSEESIYFASSNADTIKVTKVTPNGILDVSFGNSGHAEFLTSNVASNLYIDQVAIDNNGKLIVSGDCKDIDSGEEHIIVVRFNQNGTIDTEFGDNGLFFNPEIPDQEEQRNTGKTIINPDNSIIISGYIYYADGNIGPFATKINADGTIDDNFAEGGMYRTTSDGFSSFRSSILLNDNSMVLCGAETDFTVNSGMVTKLSANGELDISFGNNGYGECFSAGADTIVTYYDAILVNNEIIVTGDILDLTPFTRSTIITKLNLDGTAVDSFGENGTMIISSPIAERPSIRAYSFTEKDNEYYFAGELSNGDSQCRGVIYKLVNSQGTFVNSFDKNDVAIYPNPASDFVCINSANVIESVSIYNTMGQMIFEETISAKSYKIGTSQFENGVYFVKAKVNGGHTTTTKLLID